MSKVIDAAAALEHLAPEVAGEVVDWILIQAAACDGLRLQISTEEQGIALDRDLGFTARAEERALRLVNLRRAAARARAWTPIAGEIPRRK